MEMEKVKNIRPNGLGVRHTQTFLLFLAMLFAFCMRVNMSMAIVDMTSDLHEEHFEWSHGVQSMILSSFFWGYVILQIPAGELARRLGGKIPMTIAISVNSILSLLMPTAAKYGGWQLVCSCRVLQGLTQGFVYPSMHHLVSQWIPLEENGLLSTIIYAGGQLGIAFQLVVSGFIAAAWGWQGIFYTNAVLGLLWTAAYLAFGSESPERSKIISKEELKYIQMSLGRKDNEKRRPAPWSKIVTCLPLWAAVVAHCGQNWGFFTLMTEMPTYMAKVLDVNLKNNGVLSSLPYLAMYLLSFPMGAMTDLIIRRGWLSTSNTRRLFNTIGLWGPAIALIGLTYIPEGSASAAVVMLTVSVGLNAGQYAGYLLVIIDLAPNFSGSMMGISNFFANIISIIAPLVCGFIVYDETDAAEWRKIFILAAGVYFVTNMFFLIFMTSTRQSWNEAENKTDVELK
ncbi:putative inorganic phosphate cotransporter [Battus philenor]|uniref:putative inorganic phosphate cotransporter n=1 Tax=Battus philenor TaxID=42288 RepID=UPI0035CFF94D